MELPPIEISEIHYTKLVANQSSFSHLKLFLTAIKMQWIMEHVKKPSTTE